MVKHLPTMRETWVQSLGQEDPLEKEIAAHSSILAGEAHGWRRLVGYGPNGNSRLHQGGRRRLGVTVKGDFSCGGPKWTLDTGGGHFLPSSILSC